MRNRFSSFFIFILIIVIGLLAYFLGKKNASKTIDSVAMNSVLIQQIAELSTLEVNGNASIKSTNIVNDGSLTDSFKKLLMERTLNINVPYTAKYGVDLGRQHINIEAKNKQVYIVLPDPVLLSYELHLDKSDAISREGLLETNDLNGYNRIMQKLYAQSKGQLDNNQAYKQQSKEKIRKIIEDYYSPMGFKVDVTFNNDLKSKVIETPRQ
ncbi:MAG: DUF4230 domain-containing protein [Niabella sp.]